MDLFEKCTDFTMADDYMQLGIYPYFHVLESRQDVEVMMEGKRRIMLGSNNYLGPVSYTHLHPQMTESLYYSPIYRVKNLKEDIINESL